MMHVKNAYPYSEVPLKKQFKYVDVQPIFKRTLSTAKIITHFDVVLVDKQIDDIYIILQSTIITICDNCKDIDIRTDKELAISALATVAKELNNINEDLTTALNFIQKYEEKFIC